MQPGQQDPAWMDYQRRMDDGNLRLLSTLYKVHSALLLVVGCCMGAYFGIFTTVFAAQVGKGKDAPPAEISTIFGIFGIVGVLFWIGYAVLNYLASVWIDRRANWSAVAFIAGLNCLNMPLGTALGVFTFVIILKPHVRDAFTS